VYLLSLDDLSGGLPLCWRAFTPCSADGRSTLQADVLRFLSDPNLSGAMTDLLALMETVLTRPEGPRLYLGVKKRCHEAVSGAQIYEFIKGPLRLYWFYGEDRQVVIVPAVHHKKQRATPKKVEQMLRNELRAYRQAHRDGTLEYLSPR
jgi:hypothetical protein